MIDWRAFFFDRKPQNLEILTSYLYLFKQHDPLNRIIYYSITLNDNIVYHHNKHTNKAIYKRNTCSRSSIIIIIIMSANDTVNKW